MYPPFMHEQRAFKYQISYSRLSNIIIVSNCAPHPRFAGCCCLVLCKFSDTISHLIPITPTTVLYVQILCHNDLEYIMGLYSSKNGRWLIKSRVYHFAFHCSWLKGQQHEYIVFLNSIQVNLLLMHPDPPDGLPDVGTELGSLGVFKMQTAMLFSPQLCT